MPSGPAYLQDMFGNDSVALLELSHNFRVDKGFVIRPKDPNYVPTERENHALDYLFLEWDYAYEGK